MKTLQVRVPEALRDDADAVVAEIGIDLPTAVRLFLKKIVQTRSIPFPLEAPSVSLQAIAVDASTQTQMDKVATAWKRRRSG